MPRISIVLGIVGFICMLCKEIGPSAGSVALFLMGAASLGLLLVAAALIICGIRWMTKASKKSAIANNETSEATTAQPILTPQERLVLKVAAWLLFAFSAGFLYSGATSCYKVMNDAVEGPREELVTLADYRVNHHTRRYDRWRLDDLYLDFETSSETITVRLKETDINEDTLAALGHGTYRLVYYPNTNILMRLTP